MRGGTKIKDVQSLTIIDGTQFVTGGLKAKPLFLKEVSLVQHH